MEVSEILTRGVSAIYPSKEALEKRLKSGEKLRIYNGIDPTGNLHIGHMVVLKKLKQFQDLGHEVIVLIGDFTAQIGDPTDKSAARYRLTPREVADNARNYKKLIRKILGSEKSKLRFLHNQKWTNKLKPVDLLDLASNFTVQQLIERDMFQERLKKKKEIYLHEFLYPIFQAYDSVTMDVDMEIGGNDQIFNMLAGRNLMRKIKNKEKFVLATKLLTDGSEKKMGKTEGNIIPLDDEPKDMFGKIMSWPDGMILIGMELLTDIPVSKIEKIKKELGKKINPKDAKEDLALEVVKTIHSEKEAREARENFSKVFSKGEEPDNIPKVKIGEGNYQISLLLINIGAVSSKTQAHKLISEGAVKIDGAKISDPKSEIAVKSGMIIQVGKLRWYRIK